ncbi:MAG: flagellar biosynthetic protein FliR [Rhodospirillaceae bacterium]|jgi:flagellar biosynthesis protein FliR|nr:flagellar biosynthetic protein FliR [Rhodospirillaceae bacterium]MBT5566106.1 flagellar biosynthetic protein FliR [Rhodospirillaceae bacterium]MBT7450422.1 flagellar biosynthetic protein FliR [Rhodospirillaceae bacterium]
MLSDLLALNVFHFLLVFARLSVVFLLMPGVSAAYVPTRVRLMLAMLVTLLSLPLVQGYLPPEPDTTAELVKLLFFEVFTGAFIGTVVQMVMAALNLAGLIISRSNGLMNAFVQDPVSNAQSAVVIGFLNIMVVVLIFSTGLHGFMIMAIVDSYSMIAPNEPVLLGDMLNMVASVLNDSFSVGVRIASPFLVYALVFQVTMGIMARLSPQMNIFFVALPIQLMLGFTLLTVALPAMMLVFLNYFDTSLHALLMPGVN